MSPLHTIEIALVFSCLLFLIIELENNEDTIIALEKEILRRWWKIAKEIFRELVK